MSVIKRLSDNIINQIAAGEVVERPLSVVKELVDNAIDSGADTIKIEVFGGGQELIRVTDNGCGMDEKDLCLCFERHATSKLNENKIDYITHLGFRGEAIPSIASVACVSIDTISATSGGGLSLSVDGGVFGKVRPSAIVKGTSVEVRDLFCYTPARLKFLKSAKVEKAAILNLMQNYVLSYYGVNFSLWLDGKEVMSSKASASLDVDKLAEIFGDEVKSKIIPLDVAVGEIGLQGFVGLPNFNHASQQMIFSYVNNRIVKDKVVNAAVRVAYQNLIPHGRYPFCVLNINIDPYEVDVNVHPAKTEIRFMDPNKIKSIIINSIRNAVKAQELNVQVASVGMGNWASSSPSYVSASSTNTTTQYTVNDGYRPSYRVANFPEAPKKLDFEEVAPHQPLGQAIKQLDATYIVAISGDNLVVVDQHAAHERIVLESYKENLAKATVAVQMLLIPIIVSLPPTQLEMLMSYKSDLHRLGFEMCKFGINQVSISSCPVFFDHDQIPSFIEYLAHFIEEHGVENILERYYTDILGNIACRMSIRAGRILSIGEMNNLLRAIESTPFASECNHGRPTFKVFDNRQLAKLFERI